MVAKTLPLWHVDAVTGGGVHPIAYRGAAHIDLQVAQILERHSVGRYLKVSRVVHEEHSFKQARRGRPGPDTAYRKITRRR